MNIKSREQGNTKIIDKLVVVYAMRSVTGTKKKGFITLSHFVCIKP